MKGGNQKVFILSNLLPSPIEGRGLSRRFKISFVNLYCVYSYGLISKYASGKHKTTGGAMSPLKGGGA
jgi:hypothetical protein